MKKQLLAILIVIIAISGCSSKRHCERCARKCPSTIEIRDSIHERIVYRDTTVHDTIKGKTVTVYLNSPCPDGKPMKDQTEKLALENEWVKIFQEIKDNKILITVETKPIIRDYHFQKIYVEKLKEHFSKRSSVVFVEKPYVPWYIYLAFAASLLINLYLSFKMIFRL